MPPPLIPREKWSEVHASAVALGSIQGAADAHGLSRDAVWKRSQREKWFAGRPCTIERNRAERIEHARRAGVVVSSDVQRSVSSAASLDDYIQANGQQTRAMLSQALVHASGQARRTKHPLAKARSIKDIASAAAQVHGWGSEGEREPSIRLRLVARAGGPVAADLEINP